jgi:hypothetical protein
MADTSNGIVYTTKEWAYVCAHVGWRQPDLSRFVATCIGESQLHSAAYRPATQNPGIPTTVPKNRAGHDWSICMINDYFFPVDDPFTRLDPMTAARDALEIYKANGLKPWGWYDKRNDVNMHVAAITEEIGPNPYDIHHSPYWRMKSALINTWDLPVPPADDYVPILPPAPLRYNTGGYPPDPTGVSVNKLQRILQSMGRFTGALDYWYGSRVRDGVASIQRDLTAAMLWTGPSDGKLFSVELAQVWEGVLEAQFAFNRGTLT